MKINATDNLRQIQIVAAEDRLQATKQVGKTASLHFTTGSFLDFSR